MSNLIDGLKKVKVFPKIESLAGALYKKIKLAGRYIRTNNHVRPRVVPQQTMSPANNDANNEGHHAAAGIQPDSNEEFVDASDEFMSGDVRLNQKMLDEVSSGKDAFARKLKDVVQFVKNSYTREGKLDAQTKACLDELETEIDNKKFDLEKPLSSLHTHFRVKKERCFEICYGQKDPEIGAEKALYRIIFALEIGEDGRDFMMSSPQRATPKSKGIPINNDDQKPCFSGGTVASASLQQAPVTGVSPSPNGWEHFFGVIDNAISEQNWRRNRRILDELQSALPQEQKVSFKNFKSFFKEFKDLALKALCGKEKSQAEEMLKKEFDPKEEEIVNYWKRKRSSLSSLKKLKDENFSLHLHMTYFLIKQFSSSMPVPTMPVPTTSTNT